MATGDQQQRPHLFPQDTRSVEGYTAKQTGGGDKIVVPPKDRQQHASALRAQLAQVTVAQQQRVAEQKEAGVQSAIGIRVEFESEQGVAMAAASLARLDGEYLWDLFYWANRIRLRFIGPRVSLC